MPVPAARPRLPGHLHWSVMVKIRDGVVASRPAYLALGAGCEGARQVLDLVGRAHRRRAGQDLADCPQRAEVPGRGRYLGLCTSMSGLRPMFVLK